MARLRSAEPILEAAERWRDACLLGDGSVFTTASLWTPQNLDELVRSYAENLDYSDGDFWSKLEAQLQPARPDAKKLAAEMFWVMYLLVSEEAMGAETKRYQIRKVWEWSGEALPEDHPLLGGLLTQGVSHPGTAYNTHRWREFRFFATMLADWKKLGQEERRSLLSDPWDYATWLDAREHAPGRQLRHILLFLLFPDHFERIATASHKQKIVREFRRKWDEDPDEVDYSDRIALDREVLRVRERLSEDPPAELSEIDFYHSPLAEEWRDQKVAPGSDETTDWGSEDEARAWLERHIGERPVWLISVPGGGRLWRDFRDSDLIAIGWDYLGDLTEYASRDDIQAAIAEQEGPDTWASCCTPPWAAPSGSR